MENDNKFKSVSVETYTEDMVKAIENDRGGMVKKIIQEEEMHEKRKKNLSPKSSKNKLFMLIGIFLLLLSLAIIFFLSFFSKNETVIPLTEKQSNTILFSDKTDFKEVDGSNKDQIEDAVAKQISSNGARINIGEINAIYPTENKKVIGFKRFMELLTAHLTADQMSQISDNFLIGAFKNNSSVADPFILLRVRSFTDAFPVMRSWENKMLYDLHGIFGIEQTDDTNYLFTKSFSDVIVGNKNARVIYDDNGSPVLMYVFLNDSYVIITNSQAATNEVISRLNASKIKK